MLFNFCCLVEINTKHLTSAFLVDTFFTVFFSLVSVFCEEIEPGYARLSHTEQDHGGQELCTGAQERTNNCLQVSAIIRLFYRGHFITIWQVTSNFPSWYIRHVTIQIEINQLTEYKVN